MTVNVRVSDLFQIGYGTNFDLNKMDITVSSDPEKIRFISRTRQNLGVAAYVKPYRDTSPLEAGLITVALGGSYLLTAFVQESPFYTAQNIAVLMPKNPLTYTEKLFYCLCLGRNRFRYSAFGREANRTLGMIKVPASMPHNFEEMHFKEPKPSRDSILGITVDLTSVGWRDFRLIELFDISSTVTTSLAELEAYGPGNHPYVTTRTSNNGVRGFYNHATEEGNVLVVDSAVLGYCSYQRNSFSASDHVEKLMPKFAISEYIGMFLTTILNREQYRYSYGRKASIKRLSDASIRLPVTCEGKPDWQFMEGFIKSLPYSKNI